MVNFQKLHPREESFRRDTMLGKPRAFRRARLAETWYLRLRHCVRSGDKNAALKLEKYKQLFPEWQDFIQALEGMARDFEKGN